MHLSKQLIKAQRILLQGVSSCGTFMMSCEVIFVIHFEIFLKNKVVGLLENSE